MGDPTLRLSTLCLGVRNVLLYCISVMVWPCVTGLVTPRILMNVHWLVEFREKSVYCALKKIYLDLGNY